MSQQVSEIIQSYLDQKAKFQTTILNYLDEEKSSESEFDVEYFNNLKAQGNGINLKKIISFLRDIIDNHHRNSNFFPRIEKILLFFKDEIKQTFSNFELFEFFTKNKRIQLFLIENQMITIDEKILNVLKQPASINYFLPEIENFYSDNPLKFNESKYKSYDERRKLGENDNEIAALIRNDYVQQFISYTNQNCVKLDSTIKRSCFETNLFLLDKDISFAEYATFFGSVQILQYLKMNKVKLTSSLWMYAIHSNNADLIHLLEDSHVDPNDKNYEKRILESIKCYHNNLANYFLDNVQNKMSYLKTFLKYDNYELIPNNIDSYSKKGFNFADLYSFIKDYPEIVNLLFTESYLDINLIIKF